MSETKIIPIGYDQDHSDWDPRADEAYSTLVRTLSQKLSEQEKKPSNS